MSMSDQTLNNTFIVVGSGSIGNRHYKNLSNITDNVIQVPWRSFSRENFKTLLRSNPNPVIFIATSTKIRMELINLAIEFKAPVYIEKPIAFMQSDLDEIYAAVDSGDLIGCVGFMTRYHPVISKLSEIDMTSLVHANLSIGHDITQWRKNWVFSKSYASDPYGGGVLLDLCHEVDVAHLLFGGLEINSVFSHASKKFSQVDLVTDIQLTASSGARISLLLDYLNPKSTRKYDLLFTNHFYEVNLLSSSIKIFSDEVESFTFIFSRDEMFQLLLSDFLMYIDGKDPVNHLFPSLQKTRATNYLISELWKMRSFSHHIEGIKF